MKRKSILVALVLVLSLLVGMAVPAMAWRVTPPIASPSRLTPPARLLGDVNRDGKVNSTDALIVLTCEAGGECVGYCPMNCGDVDRNGKINSEDAKIILNYDVGLRVQYPVGHAACPRIVEACPGCAEVIRLPAR